MQLLMLCPKLTISGNLTTLQRIRSHLYAHGHAIEILEFSQADENTFLKCDVVICIHAFAASAILKFLPDDIPLLLIFGGTDLNVHINKKEDLASMTKSVIRAEALVAFTDKLKRIACASWPEYENKIEIIPQGVVTKPSPEYCLQDQLKLYSDEPKTVVVLVAGIRPIKDPLHLLYAFHAWREKRNNGATFCIIGPILDEEYGKKFLSSLKAGVIYLGDLSLSDCHAAIQQADVLVNSSISEGMSAAILEAFYLETLVIARDIEGNRALITPGYNGYLYNSPQRFIELLDKALNEDVRGIVKNAKIMIEREFSTESEREIYNELVTRLYKQRPMNDR